jgi:hypothetical protein
MSSQAARRPAPPISSEPAAAVFRRRRRLRKIFSGVAWDSGISQPRRLRINMRSPLPDLLLDSA